MYIVLSGCIIWLPDLYHGGDASFFQPVQQVGFAAFVDIENGCAFDGKINRVQGIAFGIEGNIISSATSSCQCAKHHDQHNGKEQTDKYGLGAFENST